jgi:LysR family cyn operon transcriptional activator
MVVPMLLRHLRYLLAVADHGGFTRAAEVLHVSQPTLSQQIRQLEETLGVSLFDRTSRTVRPTDAGAAYIECARRVLVELAAGKRALHDVKDLSRGSLRLAMTPTFMAYLVGPLVRDYRAQYPNIHLQIFELSMVDIEEGLANDTLDIAIAFDQVRSADIESIPAFTETLGLMVGRNHPLYDCQAALARIAQAGAAGRGAPAWGFVVAAQEQLSQRGVRGFHGDTVARGGWLWGRCAAQREQAPSPP